MSSVFLVSCYNFSFSIKSVDFKFKFCHQDIFSLSFSLVDENLLSFSCSFSHCLVLVTFPSSHVLLSFVFDTIFDRMPGLFKRLLTILLNTEFDAITVRSTHCCRLSSTRIFAVSYDRLTKSSDEMSTKTSRILVLVSVIWRNFRHSFSFVDKNNDF